MRVTFSARPAPQHDRWEFAPKGHDPAGLVLSKLVSDDELLAMLTAEGDAARDVIARARDVTRALHGNERTYVVNRNVNYTDACEYHCTFCGFKERVGDPKATRYTISDILSQVAEPYAQGVSEVCVTGGLSPEYTLEFYLGLLEALRDRYPEAHVHAFSPDEFDWLSKKSGKRVAWLIEAFKERGLGSSPGTAAEILDDEIRRKICPEKVTSDGWEAIIRALHAASVPTTSTILLGHIEGPVSQVKRLSRVRKIALATGGITEWVPLPFVPYETPLHRRVHEMRDAAKTELFYAASRLYFAGVIDHVQVSWVKLGPTLASQILEHSADDIGGTLLEENITRKAGGRYGVGHSEGELHAMIREAGCVPARRTTLYNRILASERIAG